MRIITLKVEIPMMMITLKVEIPMMIITLKVEIPIRELLLDFIDLLRKEVNKKTDSTTDEAERG